MSLQSAQLAGMTLVFFNNSQPQFQDQQVRQALLYGMNRQTIIDTILQGQGILGSGPILPNSWAYDEALKKYPYDPQLANELLDKAGWQDLDKDGVREKGDLQLAFTILTNTDDPTPRIAQQIADDWAQIGVSAGVEMVPAPTLRTGLFAPAKI